MQVIRKNIEIAITVDDLYVISRVLERRAQIYWFPILMDGDNV